MFKIAYKNVTWMYISFQIQVLKIVLVIRV
jgi:hypothetical protein